MTTGRRFLSTAGHIVYTDVEREVGHVPGIYRLHALDEAEQFWAVPRLFGPDPEGVLYIGQGENLPLRTSEVHKALAVVFQTGQWTQSRHGLLTSLLRVPRFVQLFPLDRLCLTVEVFDPAVCKDHWEQEKTALESYRVAFGELPPFNSH